MCVGAWVRVCVCVCVCICEYIHAANLLVVSSNQYRNYWNGT